MNYILLYDGTEHFWFGGCLSLCHTQHVQEWEKIHYLVGSHNRPDKLLWKRLNDSDRWPINLARKFFCFHTTQPHNFWLERGRVIIFAAGIMCDLHKRSEYLINSWFEWFLFKTSFGEFFFQNCCSNFCEIWANPPISIRYLA